MDRDTAVPKIESMPGERAHAWVEYFQQYAAPSEHSHDFVWDITREAEGPFVTDVDGNLLMDFTCHIGAAPLGYKNPALSEKFEDFDLIDPMKIAGQDLYFGSGATPEESSWPASSHLMEMLVDRATHYGLETVFLSNSGAEAVENAIKIAYNDTSIPKYGFTCTGSFHGRTLGALSLTRSNEVYTRKYPEIGGIREIPFCEFRDCTAETCECGFFTSDGSQLRDALDPKTGHLNSDEVAFIAIEPVQGVGGYRFPSETFMEEIDAICTDYDITLIVDEIQTGIGRTGKTWASDHYKIEPDIIAAGKALRVGATISRDNIFPAEENRLGSTWGGGDILSSMAGVFTLEVIQENNLKENAVERGNQITEWLIKETPSFVTDVRGLGLLIAIDFDTANRRDGVVEEALKRGLLTLGCGTRTLRLLPPLDLTQREARLGIDILLKAIDAAGSNSDN